jgi:cytochrome b561
MSALPARTRHDTLTMSLHWLIALLVVGSYAVGIIREELPKGDFRTFLLSLHMSVGMLVMGLTVARIGWRFAAPRVEPVPMPPAMALGARLAHLALYALLLAIPLVGLFAAWIKGRTVGFFGLPLPSPLALDRDLGKRLEGLHEILAHGMMLMAGAHAAAAIYHQAILKDGLLARMMPRRAASGEA